METFKKTKIERISDAAVMAGQVTLSTISAIIAGSILGGTIYGTLDIFSRGGDTLGNIEVRSSDCSKYTKSQLGETAFGSIKEAQGYADQNGGVNSVCYVPSSEYVIGGQTTDGKVWYTVGH